MRDSPPVDGKAEPDVGRRRRRRAVAAAVAAAAVLAGRVLRPDPPAPRLAALRADPVGLHVPRHAELAYERHDREGRALGKPLQARHVRWFHVPPDHARSELERAVQVATGAGWRISWNSQRMSAVGEKIVGGRPASAVIALRGTDTYLPSGVLPPALEISLVGS